MTNLQKPSISGGSIWRRWDPHLHAPGTLLNDQFNGDWDGYVQAINSASPVVEALGITDYYSIETYKATLKLHQDGKLPGVKLLFPNVEMRLEIATDEEKPVNIHLLFSPDDVDHVSQIERVLSNLTFEHKGIPHNCNHVGLHALGKVHRPAQTDRQAAIGEGANQFKITLDKLRGMFKGDVWMQRNCLVAVSGADDGSSGINPSGSFAVVRREIEAFSQIIFSANPKNREFWLGQNPKCDGTTLDRDFGGRKPCLHGCDAHETAKVLKPDKGRCCWIKGDPTFDALRHALLEPGERVWIGQEAPARHDSSSCVARTRITNAPWIATPELHWNPGLVAIIGSRGSGKTALADIVALGANVQSSHYLQSSFLHRASHPVNYLSDAAVELEWGDTSTVSAPLIADEFSVPADGPEQVRYLSQQFVEQLCSAQGLAVELRQEIERVIFEATDERLNTESFEELASLHLEPIRTGRTATRETIREISAKIVSEDALLQKLPRMNGDQKELTTKIDKTKKDMQALVPKGNESRAKRLGELESSIAAKSALIDQKQRALLKVRDLAKEVGRLRQTSLPEHHQKLKTTYQESGLTASDWTAFTLEFTGDVDGILGRTKLALEAEVGKLNKGDPANPVNTTTTPFAAWPLESLLAERKKLNDEIGIDKEKQRRYDNLQRLLKNDEAAQGRLKLEIEHANGAAGRKKAHTEQRKTLYREVFQSYLDEQSVLSRLYEPLQTALVDGKGSLGRLRFAVARHVDLSHWVAQGEEHFDLRKDSAIRLHGGLRKQAEQELVSAWKSGTADAVATAMQNFIQKMIDEFRKSMPSTIPEGGETEWLQNVAAWLYSTDHIKMRYSITYDGVEIEHLSPGTRGIVLLLLYLVIDKHDYRPLIIDQPEENLDPKSVFDELVPHFREARRRRQVIIVTHNANLVVNTDADQVIVANSSPSTEGGLPKIQYLSGSLEDKDIRKAVCDILEGGEQAFIDREKRYRIQRESL